MKNKKELSQEQIDAITHGQKFYAPNGKGDINKMTSGKLIINTKEKNFRIVEKRNWVDTYNTGDRQMYLTFQVVRDFKISEVYGIKGREVNYHTGHQVLLNGVIIETLKCRENAELLMNALKLKNKS